MKKNRTEFNLQNIIKFIPSINYKLSNKERKEELNRKIELEMKSHPKDVYNYIKKNLEKNEITKEIYLSKKISKDKRLQPNLLISKVDNCEKMLLRKNKLLAKLSKENETFLNNYKNIKNMQVKNGKMTGQLEYLNEIVKVYLKKGYDLDKAGVNNNENIFKYSILNDINFGNDVNNTVYRIIKEMDNNEFLREQKLIFEFQDELLNEKINNKIKHPAEILIKNHVKEEDDYGIDNICFIKRKKNNLDINNLEENKIEKKEINKEENKNEENAKENQKDAKNRQSYLYMQIKDDIGKLQKELINLDRKRSSYKNDNLIKFQEQFKPRLSLMLNYNDIKEISKEKEISGDDKKEEDKPIKIYNNTEINQETNKIIKPILIHNEQKRKTNKKITFIQDNLKRFTVQNKLPNINKSFVNIHNKFNNKKLNRTNTTNYSPEKKSSQINLSKQSLPKQRNSKSFIINQENQLLDNNSKKQEKHENNENNNLMKLRSKSNDIKISSFVNEKVYKNPISNKEIEESLEKFKIQRESLYKSFLQKSNVINLHGFAHNFQRITKEKNFVNLYNINKYLKRNNFSYLMSNSDLIDDDDNKNERTNIKNVDERIKNMAYDSADYLLGSHILDKN